ncbi:tRNA1(Val) (adenine(37)-N6)-methyltransferase [Pediococcus acidilactici]
MEVNLNADERIDQLYRDNIQIIQSPQFFSFSLDAVLLANFAEVKQSRTAQIVDLCAGNGAVGLFLSKKTAGHVTMVEIQSRLADMAERSILLNELEERYRVLNLPLADSLGTIKADSIDSIVCNPPYFPNHPDSKKNPNQFLAIARHEITTSLNEILETSQKMLKMNGKFFMVHRPDRLPEIINDLIQNRLAPKRIQFIHSHEGDEANMVLIEAIKDGKPNGVRILPPIITYDGLEYSPTVKEMLYGNTK